MERWCEKVAEEMVKDKPGMVALKCLDCKQIFIIDREKPLHDQVSESHTWGKGDFTLRHKTHEDWLDEQAEKELCPGCGVPHGANPYTGCTLGSDSRRTV